MNWWNVRAAIGPRPELSKRRAALIGRESAPEELATHLVIQPDHERLDESRVRFEQRDGIRQQVLETRQQQILRKIGQNLIHRLREFRRGQNGS